MKKQIKQGNVLVLVDEVVSKSRLSFDKNSKNNKNEFQATLKKYSAKTNKNISINLTEYKKVSRGERCILIFIPNNKRPIIYYIGNDYELDEELQKKEILF